MCPVKSKLRESLRYIYLDVGICVNTRGIIHSDGRIVDFLSVLFGRRLIYSAKRYANIFKNIPRDIGFA